jgi:hypothetical protein
MIHVLYFHHSEIVRMMRSLLIDVYEKNQLDHLHIDMHLLCYLIQFYRYHIDDDEY